jgi:NAD(P)-dependent dehydrogenase (short-subunit alcohol dehydrogenase family)
MTVTDITKTVLVTGPTRGLGRDLTLALGARKVRLVLLGRELGALGDIGRQAEAAGSPSVLTIKVDFASLAQTAEAAAQVSALAATGNIGRIDTVIANAGIQLGNRNQQTHDGLELTFGVNVVANQVLLRQLKPSLAANAHVAIVGSGTHFGDVVTRQLVAAPKWEAPVDLAQAGGEGADTARAGQCAYSTSKLGVNYLVHELNRRWEAPLRANVYDPGLMPGTGLARDLPKFKQWAWNNIMPALTILPGVATTKHSAEQLAQLALGEAHGTARDEYFEIGKLTKASDASFNPSREDELWEYCESLGRTPMK